MQTRPARFIAFGVLLFTISTQQVMAGDLGNIFRAVKDQGKQMLRNEMNRHLGSVGLSMPPSTSYSAPPAYSALPAGYTAPQSYAPPSQDYIPPAGDDDSSAYGAESSGYTPSASVPVYPQYDQQASAPVWSAPAPVQTQPSYPGKKLTPGPVINGFGSRRASI